MIQEELTLMVLQMLIPLFPNKRLSKHNKLQILKQDVNMTKNQHLIKTDKQEMDLLTQLEEELSHQEIHSDGI